jgi:flagellar hook-associated protein 3 FlgL
MRVTNKMLYDNAFGAASDQLDKISNLQNKLATGKAIQRPSDDPTAVNQSMLLQTTISEQAQYSKNIDQSVTWLDATDSALNDANTVLQRARTLAVEGASDTQSASSRQSIAKEIRLLKEQLRGIANSQVTGRYLFAGSQTLVQPYPAFNMPNGGPVYNTAMSPLNAGNLDDQSSLGVQVGPGTTLTYNTTGVSVFDKTIDLGPPPAPTNVFQTLENLATSLDNNQTSAISGAITQIDQRIDKVSLARADIGGTRNRATLLQDRYKTSQVSLKGLLSQYQDVDMPQLVSDLTQSQQVYQASLAASAKIIQPTLMDFLH